MKLTKAEEKVIASLPEELAGTVRQTLLDTKQERNGPSRLQRIPINLLDVYKQHDVSIIGTLRDFAYEQGWINR